MNGVAERYVSIIYTWCWWSWLDNKFNYISLSETAEVVCHKEPQSTKKPTNCKMTANKRKKDCYIPPSNFISWRYDNYTQFYPFTNQKIIYKCMFFPHTIPQNELISMSDKSSLYVIRAAKGYLKFKMCSA